MPTPANQLAEVVTAFAAELHKAIEEERQLQVLGFAMASVLKGQSLCAAVALDTLPTETLRALIDLAPTLRTAAADCLALRS